MELTETKKKNKDRLMISFFLILFCFDMLICRRSKVTLPTDNLNCIRLNVIDKVTLRLPGAITVLSDVYTLQFPLHTPHRGSITERAHRAPFL